MLKGDLVIYTLIYHHIGTYSKYNLSTIEICTVRPSMSGIPYLIEFLDLGNKAHLRGQKNYMLIYLYLLVQKHTRNSKLETALERAKAQNCFFNAMDQHTIVRDTNILCIRQFTGARSLG